MYSTKMKCISEGSYNLMFALTLVVSLIFLFISAYLYDISRKAVDDTVTNREVVASKALTMISMIISLVAIVILFVAYFAMKKGCAPVQSLHSRSVPSSYSMPSAPSIVNGVY